MANASMSDCHPPRSETVHFDEALGLECDPDANCSHVTLTAPGSRWVSARCRCPGLNSGCLQGSQTLKDTWFCARCLGRGS